MIPNPRDPAFIGALVYFDHAARYLSFKDAANELGVTPSAISHRISTLETALGIRLFERETRRVSLTRDGLELAETTQSILALLNIVTDKFATRQVLRVSVGPYLSTSWFMPQLARFERESPEIRIDLLHCTGMPDMRNVDIAIIWHDQPPQAIHGVPLFKTDCIAVRAPDINVATQFWKSQITPIHYQDRNDWCQWLAAAGAPVEFAAHGEIFNDPNLVLEATAHGRGIAIGFLPFISSLIESGRLIQAHPLVSQSSKRYWLIESSTSNPHTKYFKDWLISAAEN